MVKSFWFVFLNIEHTLKLKDGSWVLYYMLMSIKEWLKRATGELKQRKGTTEKENIKERFKSCKRILTSTDSYLQHDMMINWLKAPRKGIVSSGLIRFTSRNPFNPIKAFEPIKKVSVVYYPLLFLMKVVLKLMPWCQYNGNRYIYIYISFDLYSKIVYIIIG